MNKAQVKESFNQLEQIQRTIVRLKNLKINWETDLDKMDFSLLRSTPDCNIKKSYIDKLNLTSTHHWDCCDNDFGIAIRDKATQTLLKFIIDGNKIIPPLYTKAFIYDGETFTTKEEPGLRQTDGGHRLFLSAAIGLKEIPIIVHEKIVEYSFPMDKWDVECVEENLIFKRKDGNDMFELDVNKIWINDILFHKNIVTIESH